MKQRIQQIHEALDQESLSYGEIAELDNIAQLLGITQTEEMMAIDVLLQVEARICNCNEPQLGFIDGDYQNIYCAVCELVLGRWEELILRPEVVRIEVVSE